MAKRKNTKKRSRNENGQGSLFFNESKNLFQYTVSYYDVYDQRKRKTFYGHSETECIDKYNIFLNKIENGLPCEYEKLTIPDILEMHYTQCFESNKIISSTYQRNMFTVRLIQKSPLNDIPIADVKPKHIMAFLQSLKNLSNSVISKTYTAMKKAYSIAIALKIVDFNIFDNPFIYKPKSNNATKKVEAFTIEEQEKFLKALENYKPTKNKNYYKNQFLIQLFLGLRVSEVNALRLDDIDFKNKTLHVKRTLTKGENRKDVVICKTTKTYAGIRDIPLTDKSIDIFKNAIENMVPNKEGYIFLGIDGNFINDAQINSTFKRLCDKADIKCHGQHMLRHTFCTRCVEAGVSLEVLKLLMGHSDIQTTLNIYTSVFKPQIDKETLKYNDYLNELFK